MADDRHPPFGWATSIILKCKLLSWYCIEQLTFDGIKGPSFITRYLCNPAEEGIIGELQCFEVGVSEDFEYAARVANPDLVDVMGFRSFLGARSSSGSGITIG